ncbi:MAG TPA: DUF2721 domain-containing protein [Candidatus Didemnitutus sp.]|nr:DUF2721 domain-containing protein [Candidatus Didemnitutus sp.]
MNTSFSQLIPVLQLATGPVILISGIGLLLLSLTNRLGRMVDRSRSLHRERLAATDAAHRARAEEQLAIIDRRSGMLRRAITLTGSAVLLVSILILTLFVAGLFKLELALPIVLLFSLAILALIGGVFEFLREIKVSLDAVRLETRSRASS